MVNSRLVHTFTYRKMVLQGGFFISSDRAATSGLFDLFARSGWRVDNHSVYVLADGTAIGISGGVIFGNVLHIKPFSDNLPRDDELLEKIQTSFRETGMVSLD